MDSNRLTKQIKLSGNIRDAAWMTRQFQKGRLKLDSYGGNGLTEPISETIFNQFKTCIRIINELYEDSWDIDFSIASCNKKVHIVIKGIFILFPEVTINNRDRRTHLIKDLVVKIRIWNHTNTNIRIGDLNGGRLTMSYAEYQSNYFHSHLPTSKHVISRGMNLPYFDRFCTGSGEINIYQSNINGDGFSEERFMRYALQVMSLVSYESIEGHPYRNISRISARSQSGSYFHIDNRKKERFKHRVIEYYKGNNIIPPVDINMDSTNSYNISDNESLQSFIYDVDFTENEKRDFFCTASDNGQYYMYGSTPGFSSPPIIDSIFIFRGVERTMTIEPAPVTSTTVTYIVHPNLIKFLKEEIEYELNQDKIRQSTINRYTIESDNATESIQSNPIPVPANS